MRGLSIRVPRGRRGRVTAGVGCLLTAVVIALLPLPEGADQAQAAVADESAVTKSGSKGTYDDFSDLEVTVHQTEGLRGQAVRVTWTGGKPQSGGLKHNFLQIMQCWGDDAETGPDREQCEFGAETLGDLPGNTRQASPAIDSLDKDYATDPNGSLFVPFRPVEGPRTTSRSDFTYFTNGDTNSISYAANDGNGGGDVAFEVKSALESPHLGCGARTTSAGRIRPCWLVVVPRGEHEPNGTGANQSLQTSALSQSNWNQRIAFPLAFEPVTDNCDPDKPERGIEGSELATDAITSWQAELCKTGTHRFTYTQSSEQHARESVTAPSDSSTGLAMTLDPVRTAEGATPVVHAPVAISGLTISFVWMYEASTDGRFQSLPVKDVKLNQRLLAKALTQSYPGSLVSPAEPVPAYLSGNPRSIAVDPEFLQLNPGLDALAQNERNAPLGLVVTSENSDSARIVWDYILADPAAREFIEGKADPSGMKVNPAYQDGVISDSLDYFPKTDLAATRVKCGGDSGFTMDRTGQDVVPYATDMHEGALKIRRGDIGTAYECQAGNNVSKMTLLGRPALTQQRAFGIVDNASAVRYQLGTAALPNADGEYIEPTDASLLKAVAEMPDSDVAGVRAADPAEMKDGAYPLAAVVYAAASLDQAEDARQDYAKVIRYAADKGQAQGTAGGQLPYGYAPLPTALREQAQQAAERLEKGAPDSPEPPGAGAEGPGGSGSGGGTAGGLDGGTGSGGLTGGDSAGAAGGTAGAAGVDGAGTSPPGAPETDPAKQNVAQSGGLTPSEVLGLIRWVLLGVLIAGGVAALAGPVMLRLSARRAAGSG
ncbi:hypothetical protein AB0L99_43955 [Streptomyces sp. NPDC051954]|uniref:hypothetical protein n=1 Tax=unclassified Streptomyces TaxID=2593676 RepID=UPI00341514BD